MQVLFKDYEDRKAYAQWDAKAEGMTFVRSRGSKLTEEDEDLISGVCDSVSLPAPARLNFLDFSIDIEQLVKLAPSERYQLRHLRDHSFFVDHDR